MAITLITGQPGHGKTQWAIAEARRLAAEGRTVYAGNIRGLKYGDSGFVQLDSLEDWEALPDGSVVLWDECYDALPQRGPGRKVPDHVEALARHRHRGFDFLFVCQQPKQLDSFVSGLIERHIHARRKFGTQVVRLKEWDKWERDPDKAIALVTSTWRLDPKIWPLYESATQHTMQRRIPWYYYALPLAIVAVVAAFLGVPGLMISKSADIESQQQRGQPSIDAEAARIGGPAHPVDDLRQTDPLAYIRPRLPAMPWTAPAYDGAEFAPPPRLACISSARSCTCMAYGNGNAVRWRTDDDLCRIIAREGIYDPIQRDSFNQPAPPPQPPTTSQPLPIPSHVRAASQPFVGDHYRSPDLRASIR